PGAMTSRLFTGFLVALVVPLAPAAELSGLAAGSGIADPDSRVDDATLTHVLNRLTFGPRPDDLARLREIGIASWIDQQLHPERIDDHAVAALLPTLEAAPGSADPQELRRFARQQVQALAAEKILRATYSERQLQEVLA